MINSSLSRKGRPNPKNAKHSLSTHPVYRIWAGVKNRCHNPRDPAYRDYGARGVEMCPQWKTNPREFIEWALANGWKKGLQIDKDIIAAKLNAPATLYSPERCLFVTRIENGSRKRSSRLIEYKGVIKSLMEWSRELNIKPTTLTRRLDFYGYSIEKAFAVPVTYTRSDNKGNSKLINIGGIEKNIKNWCLEYNIDLQVVRNRMKGGGSFEEALKTENKRKRIPAPVRVECNRLYAEGISIRKIGEVLNIKRTSISRIIKAHQTFQKPVVNY